MDNPLVLPLLAGFGILILVSLLAQIAKPMIKPAIRRLEAHRTRLRLADLQALTVGSTFTYSGDIYIVTKVMEIRNRQPGVLNVRRFLLSSEGRDGYWLEVNADEQANRLLFATPQQCSGEYPEWGDDYSFELNGRTFVRPEKFEVEHAPWVNYPIGLTGWHNRIILVPQVPTSAHDARNSRITLRFERFGEGPWTLHLCLAVAPLSIKL